MKRTIAKKSGIMLTEVMLCMAIGMVLLGIITTMFIRVEVMNPAARDHLQSTVTLGRLAEQFRQDVHAATEATASEIPTARLRLQRPGDVRVEYEAVDRGLRRTMFQGDQAQQREQFVLPGMKVVGWDVRDSGREVSLTVGRLLQQAGDEQAAIRFRFLITARLARDHRFALDEAPK